MGEEEFKTMMLVFVNCDDDFSAGIYTVPEGAYVKKGDRVSVLTDAGIEQGFCETNVVYICSQDHLEFIMMISNQDPSTWKPILSKWYEIKFTTGEAKANE